MADSTLQKYTLDETGFRTSQGKPLFRVRALRMLTSPDGEVIVYPGDPGGLVEGEHNLSHEDSCWVFPGAQIIQQARAIHNCLVTGHAILKDHACGSDSAIIGDFAIVGGHTQVSRNAEIRNRARLLGHTLVGLNTWIGGRASLYNAHVRGQNQDADDPKKRIRVGGDCRMWHLSIENAPIVTEGEHYGWLGRLSLVARRGPTARPSGLFDAPASPYGPGAIY